MGSCLKSQFIINNLLIYVQLASGTRKMHDIILHVYALLWNHFYSFGPKFVDYQIFAGSLGRHFISNWFVSLPCKTIQNTGKRSRGCKDVAKVNPRNPQHFIPKNNDDSTVSDFIRNFLTFSSYHKCFNILYLFLQDI